MTEFGEPTSTVEQAPKEKSHTSKQVQSRIEEEGLTDVKRNGAGKIDSQYFLKLLNLIMIMVQEARELSCSRKEYLHERRMLFKAGDWEKYQITITTNLQVENAITLQFLDQTVSHLGIDPAEFGEAHQTLA